MKIRKAEKQDAHALAALGAKTFYDTFSAYHDEEDMQAYIGKAYSEDAVAANLEKEHIQYFITFEGDQPVGYIKLLRDATHEKITGTRNIELEKIYVLQEYLGKKVGKELMVEAIRYAKEHGFDVLFLGVWQDNVRAVKFYEQFGFETFTTRTFQLGSQLCDDFIMKLDLRDPKIR